MMRNLDTNPYSLDELRAADYLASDGIIDDDPVGFLIRCRQIVKENYILVSKKDYTTSGWPAQVIVR